MNMLFRFFAATMLFSGISLPAQTIRDSASDGRDMDLRYIGKSGKQYLTGLMDRQHTFKGSGTDTFYRLPEGMIIFESETVETEGLRMKRGTDYRINYRFGEIDFMIPVSEGVTILVKYKVFPFGIKEVYRHRDFSSLRVLTDTARRGQMITVFQGYDPGETALFGQSNLTGSGSITRGFTIGSNQDFTLNSGLNIQISGQITDDVTIEASLTDESTPIQPEGNTETLQEIDKVFIEIRKADRYSATFGDFDFTLQGTEFGNYARKLQGVKAMANTERVKADIAFAATEGRYATNNITVSEGVQGPYELSGASGEKNILVIAGTEKVWLNGVQMRRGEDQDYIIDYSAAQLWFTRRRLIAPESRVVVDFEYTEDLFRRNTLAGKLHTNWFGDQLAVGGVFIHEYDDKDHPVNLSLSSQLTDSLSKIDDRTIHQAGNVIFVSGAVYTGSGRGAYIRIYDSAAQDTIFIYQGADSAGDYNVRFTNVGANRGDYTRGLILGEFRYAGRNQGDYLPVVPLTLPTTNTLGSVFLSVHPARAWKIYSEFAVSGFDVNAFSPGQITGKAILINVRANNQAVHALGRHLGEFDLNARIRYKDSLFTEVGRMDQTEFSREWNLQPSPALVSRHMNREIIREISAEYRPVSVLRIAPYYGHLEKGAGHFLSDRAGGLVSLNRDKLPFILYRLDGISTKNEQSGNSLQSSVRRQHLITRYRFWKMEPGFELETEKNDNTDLIADSVFGTSYLVYRPKIDFTGFTKTSFGVSHELRYDRLKNTRVDTLNGTLSVASTSRIYWTISNWRHLTSGIEYVQRKKVFQGRFRTADNPDKTTRLASSSIEYSPLNQALKVTMNYQVSEEQMQNRKIIFIPVGPNQGNYIRADQDSFLQVPQGQGDWVQGSVRSNQFTPVVEISAGFRLRIEMYRWLNQREKKDDRMIDTSVNTHSEREFWRWLLLNTAWETFIRVEENQNQPDWSFYFLNWNVFQKGAGTIRGSASLRQDLILFPQRTQRSVRLRYEHQQSLTNLLIDGKDRRKRILRNLRWREQLTPIWSMEHELEYETNRRRSQITFSGNQPDFTIQRLKGKPGIMIRPGNHLEIVFKAQWMRAHEETKGQRADIYSFLPEINYSFQTKGRLTAGAEAVSVKISHKDPLVLYELADGNQKGITYRWMIHGDYRIGEHLSAGMNYTGRKEPGQSIIHIASAELRAFF